MNVKRMMLALTASALCAAIPLAAATTPASKTKNQTTTGAKATKTEAVRSAWPPETFSAQIAMVDPAQHLVVLKTADKVTYDIVVTPKTKIESGNQALTLKALSQDKNRTVSVSFTPERRGDVAKTIQING